MLALTAGVFTVASTSRQLAHESTKVHQLDKALTSATVVRAQLGFGLVLIDLDEFAAIDTADAARSAQDDIEASLASLRETKRTLDETLDALESDTAAKLDRFERLVESQLPLNATTALDDQGARELEQTYAAAADALVTDRDIAIAAVQAADDSLGQLSTLIGFLTAFVIPSLAIIIYRLLTTPRRELLEAEALTSRETAMAEIRREVMFERLDGLRQQATAVVESGQARSRLDEQFTNLRHTLLTLERTQHCAFTNVAIASVMPNVSTEDPGATTDALSQGTPLTVWSDPALLKVLLSSLLADGEKRGASSTFIEAKAVGDRVILSVRHDGATRSPAECRVLSAQATVTDRLDLLRGPDVELVTAFRLAEDLQGSLGIEDRADGTQVAVLTLPLSSAEQEQPSDSDSGSDSGSDSDSDSGEGRPQPLVAQA